MTMRRTLIATFAFASLLGGASALRAQTIQSPIRYIETKQSVAPFVGYLWTDPTLHIRDAEVELGPQSAVLAGLQYNIHFAGPLYGEVLLGFSPTERKVYVPGSTTSANSVNPVEVGTTSMALALADAGLHFNLTGPRTWRGIAPYAVASGGVVADLKRTSDLDAQVPDGSDFDLGPSFALGLGIGTDWYPTQRLSIRAEGRDRFWRISAPQGLRPADLKTVSEWNHNFSLSIGAALHF